MSTLEASVSKMSAGSLFALYTSYDIDVCRKKNSYILFWLHDQLNGDLQLEWNPRFYKVHFPLV